MESKDGGPAYPTEDVMLCIPKELSDKYPELLQQLRVKNQGMSLRQWLAATAPHDAIMEMWPNTGLETAAKYPGKSFSQINAILRYEYADSMLSVLNEK